MSKHEVEYLTGHDLLNINDQITGEVMIRDIHLLNSALRRPMIELFGEPQFPTLTDKAAAYLESLAYHHLFIDGNKRTAVQAVELFFARNGVNFRFDPTRDYEYILEIARGSENVKQIAVWLSHRIANY